MSLLILFNQFAPERGQRGFTRPEDPFDLLSALIEREDDEVFVLVPCFMKVIRDANAR